MAGIDHLVEEYWLACGCGSEDSAGTCCDIAAEASAAGCARAGAAARSARSMAIVAGSKGKSRLSIEAFAERICGRSLGYGRLAVRRLR